MSFSFKLITLKEELREFKQSIFTLFNGCFNKDLPEMIWDWAYLQNPYQNPIVSLCFDEMGMLVGHYAIIPLMLKDRSGSIKAGLSMTTMVLESYRKNGIFIEQASRVYQEAARSGFHIIVGFPNKNSAPGFRKRLGWEIQEDHVVTVTGEQLAANKSFREYLMRDDVISLDLADPSFKSWRLSKPGTEYQDKGLFISKEYKGSRDIVFMDPGYEKVLVKEDKYNVLVDGTLDDFKQEQSYEYPFGFKVLRQGKINKFKKDLLLSDVF